jgi:hypothetical protein
MPEEFIAENARPRGLPKGKGKKEKKGKKAKAKA